MSLDIYLSNGTTEHDCVCNRCGDVHKRVEANEVYSANITHNLNSMAAEAGLYEYLWRPDVMDIVKASELIEPLSAGLKLLKSDPPRFEKHNAKNGWGRYEHFVPFVEKYLMACIENPDALVSVSR